MFLKIYIIRILVLINFFSTIPFYEIEKNESDFIPKTGLNFETVNNQLVDDYQQIREFSKTTVFDSINQTNFEKLFQEGLLKSFYFHRSSKEFDQSYINRILEKNISSYPHQKHPIKRPSKNTSKNNKHFNVLNTFSGKWEGKWKSMDVRHLWLPIRTCAFKVGIEYELIGFQTCFTGDGFGWNYVVRKKGEILILGHVYHFNENGKLDYQNPHYAYLNNHNQLTWVSDSHIYYEFICEGNFRAHSRHYIITAMPYHIDKNRPKFGAIYQAMYISVGNFNSKI